jgi:hypothetical protein
LKVKCFDVILIATRLSLATRAKFVWKCKRWHRKNSSRLVVFREEDQNSR